MALNTEAGERDSSTLHAHPPPVFPVWTFSVSHMLPPTGWQYAWPLLGSAAHVKHAGQSTLPQGSVVHSPVVGRQCGQVLPAQRLVLQIPRAGSQYWAPLQAGSHASAGLHSPATQRWFTPHSGEQLSFTQMPFEQYWLPAGQLTP
jgi:hypothetical protein